MRKILFLIWLAISVSSAQDTSLFMTHNFSTAYINKTRSPDGKPGSAYWQNRADYIIEVNLDPASGVLTGKEDIHYTNHSPDTLTYLMIHIFPNVYKKGTPRDFVVRYEDESEGVLIDEIKINHHLISTERQTQLIEYLHYDFKLHLPHPLAPQNELHLRIAWHYTVNKGSHMRTGQVDSTSFFIAYFFPRIAVYDDIDGWNDFFYSGRAEFYNDFGSFHLTVDVPENFVVWATGELQNPEEVFSPEYQHRLQEARHRNQILPIISEDDDPCRITRHETLNSWKFKASDVSDVAFAVSDHYLWQGSSLLIDNKTDRRVFISAAFNRRSDDFYKVGRNGSDNSLKKIHFLK